MRDGLVESKTVTAVPGPPSREPLPYRWLALGVLLVGVFMAILDSTVVNIAIPRMMAVFNATPDEIEWVITAYMLMIGVLVPSTGYLQDTFGEKRIFMFALAVFTLGSALCGFAWSTGSMVAFRVFQAIGGGMIMPVSMSMVYRLVPPEERGFALGIWGIALVAGPAIGPTLSGYIVQNLNWRLIFTINIPIGLVGLLLAALVLQDSKVNRGQHFDLYGLVTSGIGLSTLLLALNRGSVVGWTSPLILTLLGVALTSLSIFIVLELGQEEPLLDLTLFRNRTFTLAILITSINTIALYAGIFLIPLFMQTVVGLSPLRTGLLVMPAALVQAVIMPISGRLFDLFGARPLIVLGLAVATFTTYQFHTLSLTTPIAVMMLWYMYRGLGMALTMMPATTAALNTVPLPKIGRATALSNCIRQVAGSFGIAIFTTLLQQRQLFHAAHLGEGIRLSSLPVRQVMARIAYAASRYGLDPLAAKKIALAGLAGLVQREAFVSAIDDVFWVATFFTATGMVMGFFLREQRGVSRQPGAPAATPQTARAD